MTYEPPRIGAVWITTYVNPGWNRRNRNGELECLTRRQLVLHRILWGFNRLVYIEPLEVVASRILLGVAGARPTLPNWAAVGVAL